MIVRCTQCGKKYKVNLAIMNSDKGKFNCHNCKTPVIFSKPSLGEAPPEMVSNETAKPDDPLEQSIHNDEPSSAPFTLDESSPETEEDRSQNKKRWRFGVVQRLTLIMVLIGLIPLIGFGIFSLRQTSHYLEDEMTNERREVIESLVSHVDEWIDKNVRALNTLANMPDIQGMDGELQRELLKVVQKEYPWMYLVFTLDVKGKNVARSDEAFLKDYSDRQYFREVLAGEKLAWQTLIGKTSQMPAMVLSVPIMADGKLVGVLATAMTTDELSKNVVTWKKGETGLAFLVDETGKVLAHRTKPYVLEEKNLTDHPLIIARKKGRSGNIHFQKSDGQKYVGAALNTKYGWTVAIEESRKEAYAVLRYTQTVAVIILFVTVIGVILINIGLGRTITRPIRTLIDAADQISLGELDVEIDVKRNDEIGDLAESINRMKDSIRLSIKRLRRCKVR